MAFKVSTKPPAPPPPPNLRCSDQSPVTRGRSGAEYPLLHGPKLARTTRLLEQ